MSIPYRTLLAITLALDMIAGPGAMAAAVQEDAGTGSAIEVSDDGDLNLQMDDKELEFRVSGDRCILIAVSGRRSCTTALEAHADRAIGNTPTFLSLLDGPPGTVLADALEWPATLDARLLERASKVSLLRLISTSQSLVATPGSPSTNTGFYSRRPS